MPEFCDNHEPMLSRRSALPAFLLLGFALATSGLCSQTFVSPVVTGSADGSSQNTLPWLDTRARRYLQIHGDLPTSVSIKKLAWRKNAGEPNGTGVRMLDLEIWMGASRPWKQPSFVFADNYLGAKTAVLARTTLNLGPLTSTTNPPGFDLAIPFSAPYPHSGGDLVWEAVIHSCQANGSFPTLLDTDSSSIGPVVPISLGSGCVAGGQSLAMALSFSASDVAGTFTMGGFVDHAPPSQMVWLGIGTSDPVLSIFGLCEAIHTDLMATIPLGVSDANGYLGETFAGVLKFGGGPLAFVFPNNAPGSMLYLQAFAIDPGSSSALPLALSNAQALRAPQPVPLRTSKVTRLYNGDGGTSAVNGIYLSTSTVGYGLVTEFTY